MTYRPRKPDAGTPEFPAASTDAATPLFLLSLGVFFIGGFVAASISLLVPGLRLSLGLDYTSAATIQLASHSSYLFFALPIAAIVAASGYMRAHALGLALMALGCSLVIGGFAAQSFALVLSAVLLISCGATFLQIASNTAVTLVGDPKKAAFRLNLLQGLNSLGTVAAPLVGASTLVGTGRQTDGPLSSTIAFGSAAFVLAVLAIAFLYHRNLLRGMVGQNASAPAAAWRAALRRRHLLAGAGAIFCYVGAEVTIGALLTDFLMTPHALHLNPVDAARMVALYWSGAMVGRLVGAGLLRRVPAPSLLAFAAAGAIALSCIAVAGSGGIAGLALISVGLMNSVMYPTIYVLSIPEQPEEATPAATILCMAVVGGAIVPAVTGFAADALGLVPALLIPAACYIPVLAFARLNRPN